MDFNEFPTQSHDIYPHIDDSTIAAIEKKLDTLVWVQFHPFGSIEPNRNDLKILNGFYKKHPHIYLRYINPSWLKHLPNLQRFYFGFNFCFTNENIELIKKHKVTGLFIEDELSKKDDLSVLGQFGDTLTELALSGNPKNIDKTLSQLKKLKRLDLINVKLDNLDFLEGIELEHFFNYGSKIKNFDYLENIKTLKTIRLKTHRSLDTIDFIAKIGGLEKIELEYLYNITHFPNMEKLDKLKEILIYQCNKLKDIEELKRLKNVEIKAFPKLQL